MTVSIRAPVRRPGRLFGRSPRPRLIWFQSAPRSGDRGDYATSRVIEELVVSIRAPVRRPGRSAGKPAPARRIHVSIRAPVRRPGRSNSRKKRTLTMKFQSAPRSGDRGDVGRTEPTVQVTHSFNPRPGPETGAIGGRSCRIQTTWRFNPRPGPETGAIRQPGDRVR